MFDEYDFLYIWLDHLMTCEGLSYAEAIEKATEYEYLVIYGESYDESQD